ncbi:Swt1 family HEPN domain-containing protein [Candidatus Poriferisodalis sp.]|uniref:Swt1 family HEPN domain-containing protein n=1 Tax=Candidatus Poriferisodalis sp. TaxID=3101277 RepID=UPI003C6F1B49
MTESLRGWWELEPDDIDALHINYVVAFHRGRTLAVAKIDPDSWKWLEIDGSGHHTTAVDALGNPRDTRPRGGDTRVRWAFDVPSGGAPSDVWDAWVGSGGKRLPERLHHTITSFWPASPADSAHDLLGKAVRLLGRGLRPFMRRHFQSRHGVDWLETLRRRHGLLAFHDDPASPEDPYVNLMILRREWSAVSYAFARSDRATGQKLLNARNRWAHFGPVDAPNARSDAASILAFLNEIGASNEFWQVESIVRALDLQISRYEGRDAPQR